MEEDKVCLITFFDAIDAGRACHFLEDEGIDFEIEDLSERQQGVNKFVEGPAILMNIYVASKDRHRAQECLRTEMRLFPEDEIDSRSSTTEEEDSLAEALVCDSSHVAHSASQFLTDSGIPGFVRSEKDDRDGHHLCRGG